MIRGFYSYHTVAEWTEIDPPSGRSSPAKGTYLLHLMRWVAKFDIVS